MVDSLRILTVRAAAPKKDRGRAFRGQVDRRDERRQDRGRRLGCFNSLYLHSHNATDIFIL